MANKVKKAAVKVAKVVSAPVRVPVKKIKKHHSKKSQRKADMDEVADLMQRGLIKSADFFKEDGTCKSLEEVLEKFRAEHPEDDAPEEAQEEQHDPNKRIIPAFDLSGYVFDDNGNVTQMNSSEQAQSWTNVTDDEARNYIYENETIRELVPNIKPEDIFIGGGLILLTVYRKESEETEKKIPEQYRIDLRDGNILVQAPFNFDYIDRHTGYVYHFVSVPISSDLGKEILTTPNRKIETTDSINLEQAILRFTADELY